LYGELPLTEGNGSVAGFDLKNLKRKEVPMLRRKIGIVFQDFQLLMDRTVIQNMIFVLGATGWKDKTLIQKRALSVLQLVGVEQKANAMPHALSGGEQQRVAIARALLNQPELLLADEPTGNLDTKTSIEIMGLLEEIHSKGNTIILVTHEEDIAQHAHRIVRMRDGLIEKDYVNTDIKTVSPRLDHLEVKGDDFEKIS
jgi:putative ABC transport system ATP-binding protein